MRHRRWKSSGFSLKSTSGTPTLDRGKLLKRPLRKLYSVINVKAVRQRRGSLDGLRVKPVECLNRSFRGTHVFFSDVAKALTSPDRSGSTTNLFVPFTWCCVIYTTCLKVNNGFPETRGWNILVGVIAILLDSILHTSGGTRHGIAKATKVRLRRGLRSVSVALLSCSCY